MLYTYTESRCNYATGQFFALKNGKVKTMKVSSVGIHKASNNYYVRIDGRMYYLGKVSSGLQAAHERLAVLKIELRGKSEEKHTNDDEKLHILFTLYQANVLRKIKPESMRNKSWILKNFLEKFGQESARTITPLQVDNYVLSHVEWSQGYKLKVLREISAAFRWCQDVLGISANPVSKIKKPTAVCRGEEVVFAPGDFERLLEHVPPKFLDVVVLLHETGARPEEILSVKAEEYSPKDHALLKIDHKNKHKGKSRTILLNDKAEAILQRCIGSKTSGFIFAEPNSLPLRSKTFSVYFGRWVDRANLSPKYIPYSCRHSFAVRHLERGIPLHIVAAWLGNTVGVCEKHYAHCLERLRNTRATLQGIQGLTNGAANNLLYGPFGVFSHSGNGF